MKISLDKAQSMGQKYFWQIVFFSVMAGASLLLAAVLVVPHLQIPFLPDNYRFVNKVINKFSMLKLSVSYLISVYSVLLVSLAVALVWDRKIKSKNRDSAKKITAVFLAAFSLVFLFFSFWAGNRQFGAYDCSMMIDAAWRQMTGQVPYRDFICTLPVGFYLSGRAAMEIFGINWNSLVLFNSVFVVITFLWSYLLLRNILDDAVEAILLSAAIQAISPIMVAHWWHSSATAVVASLFMMSSISVFIIPQKRWIYVSLAISLAFTALMKPNVSGCIILPIAVILLVFSSPRRFILASFAAAIAMDYALLAIFSISIQDVLQSYLSVSGRAIPDKFFHPDLSIFDKPRILTLFGIQFIPLLFLLWKSPNSILGLRFSQIKSNGVLVVVFSFFAGLYGMGTNWELKEVDFPLALVPLIAGPVLIDRRVLQGFPAYKTINKFVLISLILSGFLLSSFRIRNLGCGPFFEYDLMGSRYGKGFFSHMDSGRNFASVLDETGAIVAGNPKSRIFFGPRMEFCYAAFKVQSPKNVALWWHPGSSYGFNAEQDIIQEWKDRDFGTLVFARIWGRPDFTRMPEDLVEYIERNYSVRTENKAIVVFEKDPVNN